jgi:transcriptional regulator with XRE-family HTH domain
VPGLRREEVAQLAGLSVNYYTRLEQGVAHQMSDSVIEAIARALRLDDSERRHFVHLARPVRAARFDAGPETVRDRLLSLVTSRPDQVGMVVGRHQDLLAGNPLAYALYGLPPGQRVNLARQTFLEPAMRTLYVDWEGHARHIAAYLRLATSELPDEPRLAELIGELTIKSSDFVRLWSAHPVGECSHGTHEYDHPRVGRLTLVDESLRVPDIPGQRITFMTPDPRTDSADRLLQLADLTG